MGGLSRFCGGEIILDVFIMIFLRVGVKVGYVSLKFGREVGLSQSFEKLLVLQMEFSIMRKSEVIQGVN